MDERATPSIIVFRAANFLVYKYAIEWKSESLGTLNFEMKSCAGHPSGDPALPGSWQDISGTDDVSTAKRAAEVASNFIELEGARAEEGPYSAGRGAFKVFQRRVGRYVESMACVPR